MHDANFAGKKASQSQVHAWYVLDRNYCGPATINPVSIYRPGERMPWHGGRSLRTMPQGLSAAAVHIAVLF